MGTSLPPMELLSAVPMIDDELEPDALPQPRDCRLGPQLRERFGTEPVRPCGTIKRRVPLRDRAVALACVEQSMKRGEPFVVEQSIRSIDSQPGAALVGVVERGRLVLFSAWYEHPSCDGWGNCRGGSTVIRRCERMSPAGRERHVQFGGEMPSDCDAQVHRCFQCERPRVVARCKFRDRTR